MQIVEVDGKREFVTVEFSKRMASVARDRGLKVKCYTCGDTGQDIMTFVPNTSPGISDAELSRALGQAPTDNGSIR